MPGPAIRKPPTGLGRLMVRLPIYLYRMRLGPLMGGRFLLLNHIGRKSGLPRQAVIEVGRHDPATGSYVICSGFGEKSAWYQNLMAHPDVTIQVGNRRLPVRARRMTPEEGSDEMLDYAKRHPKAAKKLAGYMGFVGDGGESVYREVGRVMPFIELTPRG